jgi:acetyl esterase/lipase
MTGMPAPVVVAYGGDPNQVADLYLPATTVAPPWPVVVVVHGGFWGSGYGRDLGAPLSADLAMHGVAAWNIEYRRMGNGGGWPTTFADASDAVNALADKGNIASGNRLDVSRVVAVGHSAGGHLAMWLACRHQLAEGAPGARAAVRLGAVVSQAGVLDLVRAAEQSLGGGAVVKLLGGTPEQVPQRYAEASPYALLPSGVASTLVHGLDDDVVPIDQSDGYAAAAWLAGDQLAELRLAGVEHFALIDVTSSAWATCRTAVLDHVAAL